MASLTDSTPARKAPAGLVPHLRYWWVMTVATLAFIFIGTPAITIGYFLKLFFGVEDFVFPFAKFGSRLFLRAAGARAHISGLEHLDPHQAYVFVANHQSTIDPPALFALLGKNVGALAKKELSRFPIFGQGMPLAHIIPIDRSNHEAAIASTRRGAEALREGHSLMAFPEGTRTIDGRVKPFKRGVFFMAIEAGVPVVPVVINDTRQLMRKGTNTSYPGDFWIEVLPPISTRDYPKERIEELVARVRNEIAPRVRVD
jgi:1-acyl-sn-glycerol-3-phosphate acyltransferase